MSNQYDWMEKGQRKDERNREKNIVKQTLNGRLAIRRLQLAMATAVFEGNIFIPKFL